MKKLISLLLFAFSITLLHAQIPNKDLLENILRNRNIPILNKVLNNPKEYRYQIIYVQINRDKNNQPHFTQYNYRNLPDEYFNPASVVKLPAAALALQKLNDLKISGVNKYTTIHFDSSYEKQTPELIDSSSKTGLPSIAHYIKRAFLISENDAYNRLYEFLGQQYFNRELHDMGYKDIRITRQFTGMTLDQNRHTNQLRFLDKTGKLLYLQTPAYNKDPFNFSHTVKIGNAWMNMQDSIIHEPFDFTKQNNLPLQDMVDILKSIIFPKSMSVKKRFRLTQSDYDFLRKYLSQYPSETSYPKYDTTEFYNSYAKFFFRDSTHHTMPPYVRDFNKVGWAYGFLSDVSYIMDTKNNVEFFLAAVIYANSDGIINDNTYDYTTVGHPFLYQVGQAVYQSELHRKYLRRPDFSKQIINYDHRDPADTRPSIKEVDN